MSSTRIIRTCAILLAVWVTMLRAAECRGAGFPSDPIPITHWGTDEGLGPGQVMAICQTREGYLWFGSTEGLMRFDGVRCTVFDARNTPELRANGVMALYEDRQGWLWIGTSGGGLACRRPDGRFLVYGKAEGLANEQISVMAEDASGRLWVGTDGGGLFEFLNGGFRAFSGNTNLPSSFIRALVPAAQGGLWVGSNSRLCRIHDGHVDVNVADSGPEPTDTPVLLADTKGTLWAGGGGGLFRLDQRRFTQVGRESNLLRIQTLCFGVAERLWIGTVNGLARLDGNELSRLTTDQGLSGNLISEVFRDREGSIWIGNDVPGVDQIRFNRFASLSTRQGLSHPITTSIYEDREGALWIGTHQGVNKYAHGQLTQWAKRDGLSANLVFSVFEDAKAGIWIGTESGLNHFVDGKFRIFRTRDGLPSAIVWCLYRDPSGVMWAGTRKGLVKIREDSFEVFNHDNSGLSHDDVRAICEDTAGQLWVGTSYGLNRFENGRFVSHVNSGPDQPLNVVLALHADRNGDLWIGTMEQGLLRYRNGTFTSFTRDNGLHDNLIYRILEDDGDNLWMSCNRGIFRVSKAELNAVADGKSARIQCTVFGKSDGLLSTECNGTVQPAGWKARDGRLWFPTTKGVAVIDPQHLPHNQYAPPVVIEEVTLNGKAVVPSPTLEIGPDINSVEIRYSALSYVAPELVRFKYRLEGLDPDWLPVTSERVARYTHLPAGRFRFRVAACNNDGVWNETGATLAFHVIPPWWRTVWFATLAILAFAGFVGGTARLVTVRRYRRRMAELEHQHALERERSRIARDMHDGLGSDLVKISMLGEIAESQSNHPEALRPRLLKITQTARDAVRNMDEIVWAVNPKNDTVENLANYLCQFAREHLEDSPTALSLDVPPNLPDFPLRAEVRHNLFLMVKEALNNAVKHAQAAEVWLRVNTDGNALRIEVEDNGCGMAEPSTDRKGHGMENLQNRTVQIGGQLEVQSRPGQGTKIIIKLKLP
jgi:ligand-binding sensor domain-containing protein/signal transduction histidine kinase